MGYSLAACFLFKCVEGVRRRVGVSQRFLSAHSNRLIQHILRISWRGGGGLFQRHESLCTNDFVARNVRLCCEQVRFQRVDQMRFPFYFLRTTRLTTEILSNVKLPPRNYLQGIVCYSVVTLPPKLGVCETLVVHRAVGFVCVNQRESSLLTTYCSEST